MKIFSKITIVGVGLIGGSIAKACRKKKLAGEIICVFRRKSSLSKARRCKVVDKATLLLREGVKDSDLVILAVPVGKIEALARKSIMFMKKGAILTDVGSTKAHIVREAEKAAGKKVKFIGTHPMAGSEKSGVRNASADIFKGAPLIITKTPRSDRKAMSLLAAFWRKLGCNIFVLSPAVHDEQISLNSYLPHAVSYSLSASQTGASVRLAAGGLKDTTRVSSSDTNLWKDIFISARKSVLKSISIFLAELKTLEKAIKKRDEKKIKHFLNRAKKIRNQIKQY